MVVLVGFKNRDRNTADQCRKDGPFITWSVVVDVESVVDGMAELLEQNGLDCFIACRC